MPSLFSDFFDDDRWLAPRRKGWSYEVPAANIQEKEKEYVIELAAPGMEKKDFQIGIENGILCISAEKEKEISSKEVHYSRKEFSYSSFTRSFSVPENVDENKIDASYKEGILNLSLPKTKDAETPKKEIKIL